MKDIQGTGEAFSPKKRTSKNAKNTFFTFFLFLRVPDPQPNAIWIRPTKISPYLDPQHWLEHKMGWKIFVERKTFLVEGIRQWQGELLYL
jgi:hypothetical protein